MSNKFNARNLKSLLPIFLLAVAIIVTFRVVSELGYFVEMLRQIWGIITPFFYGFLLAYILSIPQGGIERILSRSQVKFLVKRKKGLSILAVYILLVLFVYLVLNLVIPAIFQSLTLFVTNFPTHYENALQIIAQVEVLGFALDTGEVTRAIQDWIQGFGMEGLLAQIDTIFGLSLVIFNSLFIMFLTLVSSIYILIEKDRFRVFAKRVLQAFTSARVCRVVSKYTQSLNRNFAQYIHTQTIDGMILGTIVTVALYAMRSPYALVLGIMLGIVNYIPYFGSIFGTLIAIIVIAFTQGFTMGIVAAIILLIIQQFDANVIQPKLMGNSFSLSPLLIIVSITIGAAIAGILGMIAAIPIVAVLKDILENVVSYYEKKRVGTVKVDEE